MGVIPTLDQEVLKFLVRGPLAGIGLNFGRIGNSNTTCLLLPLTPPGR